MTQHDVFLSYNSDDIAAVTQIANRLRARAIEPWFDEWHVAAGQPSQAALEQALKEARAAVVFIGQSGLGKWQESEIRVAIARRANDSSYLVVPVLLPGAEMSTVPPFLALGNWIEFQSAIDEVQPLEKLVAGINGKPPGPPIASAAAALAVTSARKPSPRATSDSHTQPRAESRTESRGYELTVHFERSEDAVDTRYYLPGSDAIASATRAWNTFKAQLESIATALDTQPEAALQNLIHQHVGEWGAFLFDLLFGSEKQWEDVLRILFNQPLPAPRPNPPWAPVRLRIVAADEPLLLGLPWRLAAWRNTRLVDRGWEFSTGSASDPRENLVTPAPASVLIVAPRTSADGTAADPTHVQAIVDVLKKVWPSRRELPEYLRIVRTRNELDNALRGMQPHLVYVYGHGAGTAERPGLLLDGPDGPDLLPLAQFAASIRKSSQRPAVICLNISGLATRVLAPLAGLVPLLLWRRLSGGEADAIGVASAWLHSWLKDGDDPLTALHQASSERPLVEAIAFAAHCDYRLANTETQAASAAQHVPLLTLDRDEQKAMAAKLFREFVRSDSLRVMALVAYAAPGNMLGALPNQLQHYLELAEGFDYAESSWRRLSFPVARGENRDATLRSEELRRNLEQELTWQLQSDGSEAVRHLLRRHAPNVKGTAKRGVLWLNWGLFGYGTDCQPPLTLPQLSDWLRFSSEFLAAACPDDLRIVSFLSIEVEASKHARLATALQKELWQPWCASPRFRIDHLPALGHVDEGHLFKYLGDERSGCPTLLRQEVAQRLIAATAGDFGQVVALIDLAQKGSWYDLLGKLRREQGAEQPVDDDPL